jgi:M6 family metalloprotease-like protein
MTAAVLALLLGQAVDAKPPSALTVAVVPLSFSDRAVDPAGLEALLFTDVAGYYRRASSGAFVLKGKVFAALALEMARDRFRGADLAAAAGAFEAREGAGILAAYDGAVFVAAGPVGARGGPLWPRQEALKLGERSVQAVFLAQDVGDRAAGIAAHELLHVLGLKDKYDDPKADVGKWCLMGTGYSERAPPPPCVDCRAKLGWTSLAGLDPRAPAPVALEGRLDRAIRIPLNAEGTEALLVEARDRLFVWHTGGGKAIELAARLEAGGRLTPFSDPGLRVRTAGAWSAWITETSVRDGRWSFRVGPDAPLTPEEARRRSDVGKRLGD